MKKVVKDNGLDKNKKALLMKLMGSISVPINLKYGASRL